MKFFIFLLPFLIFRNGFAASKVRHVVVKGDQIVTVETAVGIATIIQVPDRPNSVVVGDQESFKVEYLDQAITIKPLLKSAKTNLYIYTDWKRFNVQLVSGSNAAADYVVYLENPKDLPDKKVVPQEKIPWMYYKKEMSSDGLKFETKRIAKVRGGLILIEFYLSTPRKMSIDPGWIWVTQDGSTRPIHNLVFASLEISPKKSSQGMLQILISDLGSNKPFQIELRRKKQTSITIKRMSLWK